MNIHSGRRMLGVRKAVLMISARKYFEHGNEKSTTVTDVHLINHLIYMKVYRAICFNSTGRPNVWIVSSRPNDSRM